MCRGRHYSRKDALAILFERHITRCCIPLAAVHISSHAPTLTAHSFLVPLLPSKHTSYTDVYDSCGLLNPRRTVMAHCIHLSDAEIATLHRTGTHRLLFCCKQVLMCMQYAWAFVHRTHCVRIELVVTATRDVNTHHLMSHQHKLTHVTCAPSHKARELHTALLRTST